MELFDDVELYFYYFLRSYFPLSIAIFFFKKGFSLQSGLGICDCYKKLNLTGFKNLLGLDPQYFLTSNFILKIIKIKSFIIKILLEFKI
jgi:hypothetical protein